MSHPSPELILEVNIFERLEQLTQLTLGQLTQLRIESRSQQRNLIFIAFDHHVITQDTAQSLAHEFNVDLYKAPWVDRASADFLQNSPLNSNNTHSSGSELGEDRLSLAVEGSGAGQFVRGERGRSKRKFSERASLTAAVNQAISLDNLSVTPHLQNTQPHVGAINHAERPRDKKRSFSELDLKTEIEINLPSSLEEVSANLPSNHYSSPPPQKITWDQNPLSDQIDSGSDLEYTDEDGLNTADQEVDSSDATSSIPLDLVENLIERMGEENLADPPQLDSSRWSAATLHRVRSHLGRTMYLQRRQDLSLNRETDWVSLGPLPKGELGAYASSDERRFDLLGFSYQSINDLPQYHTLPVIYDQIIAQGARPNHTSMECSLPIYLRSIPRGSPLSDLLHQPSHLNTSRSHLSLSPHQIFWQLSLQVQLAHQKQIAHLALSPQALWYHQGSITLSDWEWSQHISPAQQFEELAGWNQESPQYTPDHESPSPLSAETDNTWVAPELRNLNGIQVSAYLRGPDLLRADVYSLAAVAVWLYTGMPPAHSPHELHARLHEHLGAQQSPLVETLVASLSPKPTQRPAQAADFLAGCLQRSVSVNNLIDLSRAMYAYPLV